MQIFLMMIFFLIDVIIIAVFSVILVSIGFFVVYAYENDLQ